MKCRNVVKDTSNKLTVVFFGSVGIDDNGHKIPAQEYVEGNEAVAASLIQRLTVIKGELWYNIQEGLPLFDKGVTITSMDAYVIKTIMKHPDVINISTFESHLVGTTYHCYVDVITKYGRTSLTV